MTSAGGDEAGDSPDIDGFCGGPLALSAEVSVFFSHVVMADDATTSTMIVQL